MLGELLPVWSETWRDIWSKLAKHTDAPEDLFSELYRAWRKPPAPPKEPLLTGDVDPHGYLVRPEDIRARQDYEQALIVYVRERSLYEEMIANPAKARPAFRNMLPQIPQSETDAVSMLERSFIVVEQCGIESFSNRYFELVEAFLAKFSLRYDLRRPFTLHPTPCGLYAKLYAEIVGHCRQDASLSALLRDYREAFQDLKIGPTSGRINTCLQKQVNLLEGLTSLSAGVTSHTLGQMCNEVQTWPSSAVSEAAKALYGFASDHTGLRHGTIKKAKFGKTPTVHRDMELRDLVAVSAFFTGMSAYLSDKIDPRIVYGG